MKKIIFGFVLLIGLLTACENSDANSEDLKPSKATIWEISKNENSIYLAGSMHLLRSQDYPMPAAFDYAYKKSSVLVLETDVDRMDDEDIKEYQKEKLILPEGQTLKTVLDEDVYNRLERIIGYDNSEAFSQYKPSVIVSALEQAAYEYFLFTKKGADFYYLDKAKQDGKSVGFLEDMKVQIDLLSNMVDGIENEYVSAFINGYPYTVGYSAITLVSEWKEGSATVMEASLNAEKTQWPTVYEIVILNRNTAWMPEIEKYLTTEPIEFIIVGMAHVYGPDGLLYQLRSKGYAIKQLVN
jgi:uncharacterized protein YbaP (TraB family)